MTATSQKTVARHADETRAALEDLLARRILIVDGAMGTMLQRHKLAEGDFRGDRLRDHASDLQGNNDVLVLTQPEIVRSVHDAYLAAGADIIDEHQDEEGLYDFQHHGPMFVTVLCRVRGGKGGFGALLKKLTGGGKAKQA